MRDLLAPYGIDAISAGELKLERTGRNRNDVSRQRAHQGASGGHGDRTCRFCRRFRAGGRRARWRARHSFGALGRPRPRFPPRHGDDRRETVRARRDDAGSPHRRSSSPRSPSPGRTAMSRNSKRALTAFWSGRRAATKALATIRYSCPTGRSGPSAKWRARKNTACRREDKVCRIAPAPSSNSRRRALVETVLADLL